MHENHKGLYAEIVSHIGSGDLYPTGTRGKPDERRRHIIAGETQHRAEGHQLALLRARPASPAAAAPVLLLHGSTLPGSIAYTVPLAGRSWLDDLAARGHDAWLLDVRGYGLSWKPEDDGKRPCDPVADTAQAVEDVAAAIAYIRDLTSAPSVDLVGWSWGATVAATYAAGGGALGRMVLHAPQWLRDTPSPMVTPQTLSEPYRRVDTASFVTRWLDRVDPASRAEMESWRPTLERALAEPGVIDVPNGSARDIATQWMADRPGYRSSRDHRPHARRRRRRRRRYPARARARRVRSAWQRRETLRRSAARHPFHAARACSRRSVPHPAAFLAAQRH